MEASIMSRNPISRPRYAQDYGTLVTDFNSSTHINVAGTRTAPLEADEHINNSTGPVNTGDYVNTDKFLAGSNSVRVVVDGSGEDTLAQVRVNQAMDLTHAKSIHLWVYRPGETQTINDVSDNNDLVITCRAFTSSFGTVSNYYSWTDSAGDRAARNNQPSDWVLYTFDIDEASESSPSGLADVNWFWFEVDGAGSALPAIECYLDSVYISPHSRTKILFQFDDGFESDYLLAYKIMYTDRVAAGKTPLLGTSNVYQSGMESGTILTEEQARIMYDNGWDIANHSSDDVIPGTIDKFVACRTYLDSLGFTRSSGYIAYPGNDYDNDLVREVARAGFKGARGRVASTLPDICIPPSAGHPDAKDIWPFSKHAFPFAITFSEVTYDAGSPANVGTNIKLAIDKACAVGGTCSIMLHELVASSATGNQINEASFQAIVDYVGEKMEQGLCDVVTVSQWNEGLAGHTRK
jgi:hypothetical protein